MAKEKLNKQQIKTKHKCLLCFDTGQVFNGEEYELCNHTDSKNLGLTQDEKINEYLENEEEEDI